MPEPDQYPDVRRDLVVDYNVQVAPLPRSPREDWTVPIGKAIVASAVDEPDFLARLRLFFMDMDHEVERYRHDPIATGQALAKIDALLADIRMVRENLRAATAESMVEHHVRMLVIQGIATMEASSSYDRHGWRHRELMVACLRAASLDQLVDTNTGERINVDDLADSLLEAFTPSWKLTGIRLLGLDPDDWCEYTSDDNGRPAKVPTVWMKDNSVRTRQGHPVKGGE
jgi:hypothetical protein